MMDRRTFIRNTTYSGLLLSTGAYPLIASDKEPEITRLTILHTNDVHSRIEPFPMDGSKNEGLGGVAKRATLIKKVREEQENVLLLDAGDMFQGTPYFNFFHGDLEIDLMNKMKYDAATIGNHDFDGGIDTLAKQITRANFPFVNCNYDFTNTPVAGKVHKHIVIKKGKLKIGITGCGIELKNLVAPNNYEGIIYHDPIDKIQEQVNILKYKKKG
mgnify:CR=1 FL=1